MLLVLFGMFLCCWAPGRFGPLRRGDARRSIALSVVAAAGRRRGTRRTRPSEGSKSVQVLFKLSGGMVELCTWVRLKNWVELDEIQSVKQLRTTTNCG